MRKNGVPGRCLALIVFTPFLIIQLLAGASLPVTALCFCAIVAGLAPFILLGADLYTLFGVVFMLRYVGIALIAKSFYLQALDQNLHDPQASYALAALLMTVEALLLTAVRWFDRGAPPPAVFREPSRLRVAGFIAAGLGLAAQAVLVVTVNRRTGIANTGGLYVGCAAIARLYLLGIGLEAVHSIRRSGRLFSLPLLAMLGLLGCMTLALNMRQLLIDGVIVLAVTAGFSRALRIRHIITGGVLLAILVLYVSPLVLALRDVKYGRTGGEFVELAASTALRTVADPEYRSALGDRQKAADRQDQGSLLYDYYGDGSNILNRLSYIGLLDAVYAGSTSHEKLGIAAFDEVWTRVVPRFLVRDKETRPYEYGDWLCWKIGLMPTGRIYAANFGLPMEGLAVMGLAGFILFPVLFTGSLLFLLSKLCSWRRASATSIFLFAAFEHPMIEAASDGYVELVTRNLPLVALSILIVYGVSRVEISAVRRAAPG